RDPTFPDMPTFKEVCEATDGCETSGPAWEAWKAFFVAGFPSQKIAFLPNGIDQSVVDTFVASFEAVRARPDFAEISSKRVGKYPMFVGAGAAKAAAEATTISDEAKGYVVNWLNEKYGVSL
ncbi:MAG: tricarboxylate transporter, partial [Pseudomonadota bacterium]